MRPQSKPPARGFTLVELLVVMAIISILMVFILAAASQAAQEAQRQATISLIAKLESGLTDRIQAILSKRVDPIQSHYDMAYVYQSVPNPVTQTVQQVPIGGTFDALGNYVMTGAQQMADARAQVIALFDEYRAEMPDAFFVQTVPTTASAGSVTYPINFAQQPYPSIAAPGAYALPLGVWAYQYNTGSGLAPAKPTGMYGASFTAAAGLYKNLGNVPGSPVPYLRTGVDGADNNGNGYVDDFAEGANATNLSTVQASLSAHQHNTARSEMLYALLVESNSPFFSTMNRDDFTGTEVGDTDGDGLPEFLDAWGNPIYFYRWPLFYHSDVQKGVDPFQVVNGGGPYGSWTLPAATNLTYPREVDPLDPNQLTLAPSWWSGSFNLGASAGYLPTVATQYPLSGPAFAFQTFFHQLLEPLAAPSAQNAPNKHGQFWDRGQIYFQRRAFFSRPLIISAGPDGLLGLPVLTNSVIGSLGSASAVAQAINLEGQAAPFDITARISAMGGASGLYGLPLNIMPDPYDSTVPDLYQMQGQDDISNHSTQASGGSTQ